MTQHTHSKPQPRSALRQTGAALLAAMLTVTLVATLAAAAMWQQWRAVEVETAERGRVQAAWILVGALDWSRLILKSDANSGGADHLAEPWAIPLQEARLSTFLAAEGNVSQVDDASTDTTDAFLSGQITDMQSRLNLTSLVDAGQVQAGGLKQFTRLFERLGLPQQQLTSLVEALRKAQSAAGTDDANAPLMPQTVSQLGWLGVPASTIAILSPHITILPVRTPVNLNTAQLDVLWAAIDGIDLASAQKLIASRESRHFKVLNDAITLLGTNTVPDTDLITVASRFFEVRGRLRLGESVVDERSLVRKDSAISVVTLWRERGVFDRDPGAVAAQASR
ncbi:type II secretion system minor pseudopilin GspK [Acidovorax sp. 106]|uniref:type II secretion system minor pseudopilin GspK n=1 Tax=Acidovorax sp. 106 TaxID=2135637 RepID=UPI000F231DE2|nr:type II secretion system minor pseudopilin GspK [Acidovorax sp. 106]RLJ38595.1 general secretion pathway protein K [Acidovorax sp. 106]